ncbi:AI-2E family transporter [Stieleria sp. JC731]|uniref:AI-2E family transporter n=1 Tax=Pirellulaceae TaxID=2691357 RepID=UPI001E4332C7|nr:AI-2E family transporter [Stieleria sp. JC731]MCC9602781.1 AI-2E family transporter [Stieleria sp. JC731]
MSEKVAPTLNFYLVILVAIVAAVSLWLAYEVLLVLFLGLIFGVFLKHTSDAVTRYLGISNTWSLAVVVGALLTLMTIGGLIFFVQAQSQVDRMAQTIDQGAKQLMERAKDYPTIQSVLVSTPVLNEFVNASFGETEETNSKAESRDDSDRQKDSSGDPSAEKDQSSETSQSKDSSGDAGSWSSPVKNAIGAVSQLFQTTLGFLVNALLIFFVGIFLASAPKVYHDGFLRLFPMRTRHRVSEIMSKSVETLWRWTLGRLATMAITGFGAFLLLTVLGIPMATTIGILTALLTFVPNIGAAVAFGLSLLVALPEGTSQAVMVSIGYIGLQLLESYVITPLIQQKQVAMPPALLISFQAFLGVALGFLGAVVASPMLAVGSVIVKMAYVEDVLGDDGVSNS